MKNKIVLAIAVLIFLFANVHAQETAGKTDCRQFPVVPLIAEFEQSSLWFRQWITGSQQYTSISAFVGAGEKPILKVVLVEKDGREIFYANDESLVKSLTADGREARFVPIDFKKIIGEVDAPTVYGFGFEDKYKQKILWRFIPASRPSERGRGLTPLADAPGLRLSYRNLGTLAGAGTTVRIGEKEFEAEPWTEASSPPYFVAYRGSLTEGLDFGEFRTGEETWRVAVCPKELKENEAWEFISLTAKQTLRITARRGDEFQIEEPENSVNVARLVLTVRQTPNGFASRSIELKNKTAGMRITFAKDFSLTEPGETAFQIDLGKQKALAGGTVAVEKQGENILLKWQFKSPDWARNKKFVSQIKIGTAGYTIKFS